MFLIAVLDTTTAITHRAAFAYRQRGRRLLQ